MAPSQRTVSIIIALILAAGMVLGAYILSGPAIAPSLASAATTDEALRALAEKDTDNDGLADWEESLYGANPKDAHSLDKTLTDGQAVAKGMVTPRFSSAAPSGSSAPDTDLGDSVSASGTLTDTFAQAFLSEYLQTQDIENGSSADISAFVDKAVAELKAKNALVNAYGQADLHISGSGPVALAQYAAAAESALKSSTMTAEKDEIYYFFDGITKDDAAALKKVAQIGAAYSSTAKVFAKISVPSDIVPAHLKLANALARIGEADANMAVYTTDPLHALLGLGEYRDAIQSLASALLELKAAYTTERVTIPTGQPGADFVAHLSALPGAATP